MKRFVLALLTFSVASHCLAVPCSNSYFPDGGGDWSPFELPFGQPKSVISKKVSPKNIIQQWDEIQIKSDRFTRISYNLIGFLSKNIITGIIKDGRFSSVQQVIINESEIDIEGQGESAKRALDKLNATSSNSIRGPVKIVYDQKGRITNASLKIVNVLDPQDYSFNCKFLGTQQVIETVGVSGGESATRRELGSQGVPIKELFWFLSRPKEIFTTSYSSKDSQGRVKFETVNFEGTTIETGTMQIDQKGRLVKRTVKNGSSVQEDFWTYDEHNNWTKYQSKYNGDTTTTTRTIIY